MERIALDSGWTIRAAGEPGTGRPIEVPGCWEAAGVANMESGPFVYRREVVVPEAWAGRRIGLRFGGVSYHARVRIDGREVAEHLGIWDAFRVDATEVLTAGRPAVLEVEVTKPAGLLDGPDGPRVVKSWLAYVPTGSSRKVCSTTLSDST